MDALDSLPNDLMLSLEVHQLRPPPHFCLILPTYAPDPEESMKQARAV